MTIACFLLTHSWRDSRGRFEISLHAATGPGKPLHILIDTFRPLFFVPATTLETATAPAVERRNLGFTTLDNTPVDCLYFSTAGAARDTTRALRTSGIPVFESDVNPVDRFLMERRVKGGFSAEGTLVEQNNRLEMRNPRIRGAEIDIAL